MFQCTSIAKLTFYYHATRPRELECDQRALRGIDRVLQADEGADTAVEEGTRESRYGEERQEQA